MPANKAISEADHKFELDQLRGRPDGPVTYIEALGMEVPTYLDPRRDMWGQGTQGVLMYHVPLKFRGPYKTLATNEFGPHGERKDAMNFCLCMGVTIGKRSKEGVIGGICHKKAANYSGLCTRHGGALHPLDRSSPVENTREGMFKLGKLPIEDMDEEELARGQVRKADGTWTNYRMIPAAVHQKCQAELFRRADTKLRENLLDCVETMAEIAKGSAYEPEVRIRAASWIFERVRGKNPDVVIHTQDKPFEVMMSDMVLQGGSRAASRAARAIENTIEAEVVPEHEAWVDQAANIDDEREGYETPEPVIDEIHRFNDTNVLVTLKPKDEPTETQWNDNTALGFQENEDVLADVADEDFKQLSERLKKARNQARAKRYAARAKGLDHIESYPYTWENWESEDEGYPDPDDPEYEILYNVVQFKEPELKEVPAYVKADDTRRRKRMR